jgi:transposase
MITKRRYTAEYQAEAVRLVLQEKLSVPQAARRLEISDKTLANWVRRARRGERLTGSGSPQNSSSKAASVSELEMELSKLRAENARLKMEKEILKKATAFFVKESQ